MGLGFTFFFNSILLGIGLAMDAFSVSLANGLNEPDMGRGKLCGMAGVFAAFQAAMPLAGWVCVHTVAQYFSLFEKCIPWIALGLLGYIGIKMIRESLCGCDVEGECGIGFKALIVQGVATSIDALSVGFTIAHYGFFEALLAAIIIAAVTFVICVDGLIIGRTAGTRLAGRAGILGGVILIFIGIEVFVSNIFA